MADHRELVAGSLPFVPEPSATCHRRLTAEDQRLVAALTILRDQLAPVVDELLAGELDAEDRGELARALRVVADNAAPVPMVIDDVPD